jgi:hypothetical protein
LVKALKERGIAFASLSFKESIPSEVEAIITSMEEKKLINGQIGAKIIGCDDVDSAIDDAIDEALRPLKDRSPILIGIDPGEFPGVAIFEGNSLIRSFRAKSPEGVREEIKSFLEKKEVIIRIGSGARLLRNRIANSLRGAAKVEIVDETSTSKNGDIEAAARIALIPGKQIAKKLLVEPTIGEIKDAQQRSREMSKNITISRPLAKKVLKGEMSFEEAIEEQAR